MLKPEVPLCPVRIKDSVVVWLDELVIIVVPDICEAFMVPLIDNSIVSPLSVVAVIVVVGLGIGAGLGVGVGLAIGVGVGEAVGTFTATALLVPVRPLPSAVMVVEPTQFKVT